MRTCTLYLFYYHQMLRHQVIWAIKWRQNISGDTWRTHLVREATDFDVILRHRLRFTRVLPWTKRNNIETRSTRAELPSACNNRFGHKRNTRVHYLEFLAPCRESLAPGSLPGIGNTARPSWVGSVPPWSPPRRCPSFCGFRLLVCAATAHDRKQTGRHFN